LSVPRTASSEGAGKSGQEKAKARLKEKKTHEADSELSIDRREDGNRRKLRKIDLSSRAGDHKKGRLGGEGTELCKKEKKDST